MVDPVEFGKAMGEMVREATAPLLRRIEELEARTVEAGPQGERGDVGPAGAQGEPGRDGRDGLPGVPGTHGEKGVDGRDGVDGTNGRDGVDGLGFDDLTVEHDGERTVTLKFQRGDIVKSFPITLPLVLDRGVYGEKTYTQGDGVTFGGSYWIAQKDAPEGKPGLSADWRLAVKKGRDGKAGEKGERGEKGEKGSPGLNGRDMR